MGDADDQDYFANYYGPYQLLEPRYRFKDLLDIIEESDTLQSCIDAVVEGVESGGHTFNFGGSDKAERDSPEFQAQYAELSSFFENINEEESFISVRKKHGEILSRSAMAH